MKYFFIALTTISICGTLIYFSIVSRQQNVDRSIDTDQLRSRLSLPRKIEIPSPRDWSKINKEVYKSVGTAHEAAIKEAKALLGVWHDKKMGLVESSFLNWYFSYFNQLGFGVKSLGYGLSNWWYSSNESATDQIAGEILEELENRVFHRNLLGGEMEDMAKQVVAVFVNNLASSLNKLPDKFTVPPAEWDAYLESIAVVSSDVNGFTSQPLSLKMLTAGAILGTKTLALPLTKILVPSIKSIVGSGIKALTSKAAVKTAVGTTARRAATAGAATTASGPFAFAVLGGLLAWEAWDHSSTVAENRPVMRDQIEESMRQMEGDFLEHNGPIGGALDHIESSIYKELSASGK